METAQSATAGQLRDQRNESLFYVTLFFTLLQAGFIGWDLVTLLPGAAGLLGLKGGNDITASALSSNMYLGLLMAYAGVKEFTRWTSRADDGAVPGSAALRIQRGEVIVIAWLLFFGFAVALAQLRLIARLPVELERTAWQALAVWLGTNASKGLRGSIRRAPRATAVDAAATAVPEAGAGSPPAGEQELLMRRIMAKAAAGNGINNPECRELLGCEKDRAFRLLERLEKGGWLRQEGVGKAIRYVPTGKPWIA